MLGKTEHHYHYYCYRDMRQHKFSDPKLLTVIQIKFSKSQGERQRIISNRYDRDMKIYTAVLSAMRKVEVFDTIMKYLNKVVNPNTRKSLLNTARKEKKLMLTRDYLDLIKFKQLCLVPRRVCAPRVPHTPHAPPIFSFFFPRAHQNY